MLLMPLQGTRPKRANNAETRESRSVHIRTGQLAYHELEIYLTLPIWLRRVHRSGVVNN
jgi:hypothetical protein